MKDELKPCKCGSEDLYVLGNGTGTEAHPKFWFIECAKCYATVTNISSREDAIEAWNRRV